MSEEKRTPISIYLTPRAAMILRAYNAGSGYGSKSRTVEEIILAFDAINETVKSFNKFFGTLPSDLQKKRESALIALTGLLQSVDNAVSRLNKSSE
ncbi:MAG TPA: hypothetical protein VMX17_09685 [Candidatus Glassbacteria bacterium]|nr:hypothetical protein [Candidatus Glassbacteria bacterium]